MIYLKSPSGEVFAYENNEDRIKYGAPDLVEMTEAEVDSHLSPQPTYQQELEDLNSDWHKKVDSYNRAFAVAALSDGPSEESKKLAIRADYEADRLQNSADRSALKAKYRM